MTIQEIKQQSRLILFAGFAAFLVYFSMYAFRKPFAVGMFQGVELWGINYKVILITAQVLGYALSKVAGIKVISEMRKERRAILILLFLGLAELALVGFALVPPPYNFFFMFLNGLPLGMIWGLVFSYLEGRNVTEILAAILSASFILASGVTKSIGKFLILDWGVSEYWMPAVTGALFIFPLLFAVWLIEKVPDPSIDDTRHRKKREPMTRADRRAILGGLLPGIIAIVAMYFFVTAFRDYRDNFAVEIWTEVGMGNHADVFAKTEMVIAFFALLIMALFVLIRENARAMKIMLLLMTGAVALTGLITFAFQSEWIKDPLVWMTLSGLGIYIAYVPLGSMLFERVVASFDFKSNAGFLIYVADTVGYLGSVLILFYKEFFFKNLSVLRFFLNFSYLTSAVSIIGLVFAYTYFDKKLRNHALQRDNIHHPEPLSP